jgi:hypothetical protein
MWEGRCYIKIEQKCGLVKLTHKINQQKGTGRKRKQAGHWWLMPVILGSRNQIQSHPGQIVHKTLSQKKSYTKRAGGVSQCVDLEFKPQYLKKKGKET